MILKSPSIAGRPLRALGFRLDGRRAIALCSSLTAFVFPSLIAIGVFLIFMAPFAANAEMAVIDSSNLTKNAETAAKTIEILAETKNVLSQITAVAASIGGEGTIGGTSSLGRILKMGTAPSDILGAGERITGISPDLSDFSVAGVVPGSRGMETYAKSLRVIQQIIQGAAAGNDNTSLFQREKVRIRFSQTSSEDALAASIYNRNQVATSRRRVGKIAEEATSAVTLREQVGVLTSAMLLMVEEQQQTRALLATYVQMQASQNFRPDKAPLAAMGDPPPPPPAAAAGSGVGVFDNGNN